SPGRFCESVQLCGEEEDMIAPNPLASPAAQAVCLEVVRCLDVIVIEKRSPTLDGSIPVRAAQGCKPFLDGNAAGLHLRLAGPAVLHRGRDSGAIQFTDELHDRFTADYDARVEQLVERGLLGRDGYWHRRLRQDFAWREDDTLFLWTGCLVRPAVGVW